MDRDNSHLLATGDSSLINWAELYENLSAGKCTNVGMFIECWADTSFQQSLQSLHESIMDKNWKSVTQYGEELRDHFLFISSEKSKKLTEELIDISKSLGDLKFNEQADELQLKNHQKLAGKYIELLAQAKLIKEAVKQIHGKRSETEKIDYYIYQVEKEFFGSEMECSSCNIF